MNNHLSKIITRYLKISKCEKRLPSHTIKHITIISISSKGDEVRILEFHFLELLHSVNLNHANSPAQ